MTRTAPDDYRTRYNAGWRYSNRPTANLEYADAAGKSSDDAWMDGYMDAATGQPKWSSAPRPHGTQAAIRRHERNQEPLCEPCRLERNRLARIYHHRRRQHAANQ